MSNAGTSSNARIGCASRQPRPARASSGPEDSLPTSQTLAAGVQHVIAMFGGTVLGPLLMGFDTNVAIFFSGIATLIFRLWRCWRAGSPAIWDRVSRSSARSSR